MEAIRIGSCEYKEPEPVQPFQMKIYQSKNYKKDLSWQHFFHDIRVQENQLVLDWPS